MGGAISTKHNRRTRTGVCCQSCSHWSRHNPKQLTAGPVQDGDGKEVGFITARALTAKAPARTWTHLGLLRVGYRHPHQTQPVGKPVGALQASGMLDAGAENGDWRTLFPFQYLVATAMT